MSFLQSNFANFESIFFFCLETDSPSFGFLEMRRNEVILIGERLGFCVRANCSFLDMETKVVIEGERLGFPVLVFLNKSCV